MPAIEKIYIKDFRNIETAELEFSPSVNCICGENGQGKTNLMDAVYYLSMTRSSSGVNDRFCIRHTAGSFSISGVYKMDDGTSSRFVALADTSGEKSIRRDAKVYDRLSAHMGVLPVVMVCPADSSLVSESSQERRRFANQVLSQLDPVYLYALQRYNRFLLQRNKALKENTVDPQLLEVLDNALSTEAAKIVSARRRFALELARRVGEYYRTLSGGSESVSIEYESSLNTDDPEELAGLLAACRERDLYLKYTSIGPQRDDFVFTMDSYPISKCGSQGQQKSFLVALKLSQYDIMQQLCSRPPILLLDDLFDKLDYQRTSRLLSMVCGAAFGQIFISDCSLERMKEAIVRTGKDAKFFIASGGSFEDGSIEVEG